MNAARQKGMGLVHHSDRGSQYLSIRYPERLAEAGIEPSVGSVGDSYDNALAETINGLFKAEIIHRRGPWRSFEAVESASLEWVDWFNNRRLLEPIGNIPPPEAEANFYAALETEPIAAKLTQLTLRQTTRGSIEVCMSRHSCKMLQCSTSTHYPGQNALPAQQLVVVTHKSLGLVEPRGCEVEVGVSRYFNDLRVVKRSDCSKTM
jgi:hypothetical protein